MIDYTEYPANWKTEIRPRILARAGERRDADGAITTEATCEWCGVENHVNVAMWRDGRAIDREVLGHDVRWHPADPKYDGARLVTVVLTIAHLDHDKTNHDIKDERLAALCQRCHLNYDRPHHLAVQKANREARKGPLLIEAAT